MNRVLQYSSFAILIMALVLIISLAFNLFYPYPTIEIKSPARVFNPVVRAGDVLQVEIDYTKYTDKPCRVTRQVIDGFVYSMPVYKSSLETGKNKITSLTTEIPKSIPEGKYYIQVTLEYDFPPMRIMTYQFRTEEFTVVK